MGWEQGLAGELTLAGRASATVRWERMRGRAWVDRKTVTRGEEKRLGNEF